MLNVQPVPVRLPSYFGAADERAAVLPAERAQGEIRVLEHEAEAKRIVMTADQRSNYSNS